MKSIHKVLFIVLFLNNILIWVNATLDSQNFTVNGSIGAPSEELRTYKEADLGLLEKEVGQQHAKEEWFPPRMRPNRKIQCYTCSIHFAFGMSPPVAGGSAASECLLDIDPSSTDETLNQLPQWSCSHLGGSQKRVTDPSGAPLPSNAASLRLGKRGPLILDAVLLNKLSSFNRERIPERVVHATGHGAFGHFIVDHDVSTYTMAKVFNGIGKTTKVFVRFSGTAASIGASETLRDPRGFALRFYTEDGNLDFPGLQIPAFHIRDPMIFPEITIVRKRNPQTNVPDPNQFHDFVSHRPEIIHQYLRSFGDNILHGSSRGLNGSAVNVYECISQNRERRYCKFVWYALQSIPHLSDEEALKLAGTEPDYYTKDLYNNINVGHYPKWIFGLQVMTFHEAKNWEFNPFDVTKIWPIEEFPFIPIGTFVLDKNPTDYFTQVEQAAFCPTLVPGVGASPDPILLSRIASYRDAHRYRLGTNFELIEVNRPVSEVNTYQRNGHMRTSAFDNGDGAPVYYPNSFNGPSIIDETAVAEGLESQYFWGSISRVDTSQDDNFQQPRRFLENEVGYEERGRIAKRLGMALASITSKQVLNRTLTHCIHPLGKDFSEMVQREMKRDTQEYY